MTANRLLLLFNSLLLLLILGQRTQSEGGGLAWIAALPWSSFGTELGDLGSQAMVSAGAVISLWVLLSLGWLIITLVLERQHRLAHASAAPNGPIEAPGPMSKQESRAPETRTAPFMASADPPSDPPTPDPTIRATPAAFAESAESSHASQESNSEDDASIQQVLARLQKNVPDLSPEARAELARLRAALQTLSDPETKP
jgi:hypothetical protein